MAHGQVQGLWVGDLGFKSFTFSWVIVLHCQTCLGKFKHLGSFSVSTQLNLQQCVRTRRPISFAYRPMFSHRRCFLVFYKNKNIPHWSILIQHIQHFFYSMYIFFYCFLVPFHVQACSLFHSSWSSLLGINMVLSMLKVQKMCISYKKFTNKNELKICTHVACIFFYDENLRVSEEEWCDMRHHMATAQSQRDFRTRCIRSGFNIACLLTGLENKRHLVVRDLCNCWVPGRKRLTRKNWAHGHFSVSSFR